MPSIAAFLLLCVLVTCGRAEGHPSPRLQLKRALLSSKFGGDSHLSPQHVASAYSDAQSSSPVERLTVMDFSVPELSATSPEESAENGMGGIETPQQSQQPASLEEPGASAIPTSFPMTPTKTSEPVADAPFDFSAQDDSSGSPPQATGSASKEPPRIHFRRFNSDGSLATIFVTPTKTPEPTLDPLGNFFEDVAESSPSKTLEPEMDNTPEATEASDDVEGDISVNIQEEKTFIGPEPELSPLVIPSPEVLEEDEELVEDDKNLSTNSTEDSRNAKPRATVFVSGPVTASVTWNKGEPPVASFSSAMDEKPVEENDNEVISENIAPEELEENFISASIEAELENEDEGDVAVGRLQPKSPGRPKPPSSEGFAEGSVIPGHTSDADASFQSSNVASDDANTQEESRPWDETGLESISSLPNPSNAGDKETLGNVGDDITENLAEVTPVAVSTGVSGAFDNLEDIVEPEATGEVPIPSGEAELLSVALIVRHPPSFGAQELAEEILLNSNEFISPNEWEIVTIFQLSQLSKFAAANASGTDVQRDIPEDGFISFELLLEAQCTAGAECETKLEKYKEFTREGRMDETLAAHDFSRVSVFLEGEMTERSKPLAAIGTSGLGVGVIAGIAVGSIALISLVVLVAVVAANMRNGSTTNHSSDYDSDLEFEDDVGPDHTLPLDQGSFMISNFGGTPRHSTAMIPWLNDTSAGSGMDHSSQSFISVDSLTPGDANRMSQYRFEETKSSVSGSDIDEEVSQVIGPEESGSTVYAVQ